VNCVPAFVRFRGSLGASVLGVLAVAVAAWACDGRGVPEAARVGDAALTHAALSEASSDAGKPRSDCFGCHVADYEHAHGPGRRHQVPTTCAVCHRETGYHPLQRVHPWPLTGKHDKADCFACHDQKPPVFEGLASACVDCHREEFDKSEYPGHEKFAPTCADCHGTVAWSGAKKPAKPANTQMPAPAAHNVHVPTEAPAASGAAVKAKPRAVAKPKPAALHPKVPQAINRDAEPSTPSPAQTPSVEREHPEARFPISRGNHTDIECSDCHTGAGRDSKTNTSCVGCHKRSRYDGRHGDVADYPLGDAPAYFCVECHTSGTRRTARR
jgi:hypothetical protein